MCFSLQASAIAATSLIVLGSIGIKKHYKNKTVFITAIPLIFGIQQASEAVTWAQIPFKLSATTVTAAAYIFLFFSYFFWPIWIPMALWYAEPNDTRKQLLLLPLACGIFIGCTLLYFIATTTVTSTISCAHIMYNVGIPEAWYKPGMLLYVVAIITPWFISTVHRIWLLGVAMALSYVVSMWFYFGAFTSVWCFFAGVLSVLILVILNGVNPT